MSVYKFLSSIAAFTLLAGCHFVEFPDPNAHEARVIDPVIMIRNLKDLHASLQQRVDRGEISPEIKDAMVQKLAADFVKKLKVERINEHEAWLYADVLRQAGRWEDAYKALQIAVKDPLTEDRRVNDSLQLARVAAHLGKVEEAIKIAKSTFDADPSNKAAILLAVYKEIVPEAKGKGHDTELAELVEGAIEQHSLVVVDPASDPGKAFIAAYSTHIHQAWNTVIMLYRSDGREDLMRRAIQKSEAMMSTIGSF